MSDLNKDGKKQDKKGVSSLPDEESKYHSYVGGNSSRHNLRSLSPKGAKFGQDDIMSDEFEGSFGNSDKDTPEELKDLVVTKRSTSKPKNLKAPEISLLDLNDRALQAVYNEEPDELRIEFMNLDKINDKGKSKRYS